MPKKGAPENDFTLETVYAFAHVETWLEDYSKSHGLPFHELAERVANLLRSQTGRTLLGVIDRMSSKSGPPPTPRSKALAAMEVASGPRREVQRVKKYKRSAKARRNMARAQRARWALIRGGKAA